MVDGSGGRHSVWYIANGSRPWVDSTHSANIAGSDLVAPPLLPGSVAALRVGVDHAARAGLGRVDPWSTAPAAGIPSGISPTAVDHGSTLPPPLFPGSVAALRVLALTTPYALALVASTHGRLLRPPLPFSATTRPQRRGNRPAPAAMPASDAGCVLRGSNGRRRQSRSWPAAGATACAARVRRGG